MDHGAGIGAGLVVAIALAAGILAQSLARHLKLPGIVLLLAAGVLLGPDVAGVVDPHALGPALHVLVGFAVAVILFEGGLNLSLSRLRSQATVIQRLLTIGALVTAVGGAFSARWIMGWDWRPSIAFGALVVVTGPTVVTPLLRRIKVKYRVATVLEAEGVLIDAIGAVLAVVTLQVLISPSGSSIADGAAGVVLRLGFGLVVGLAGGALVALALRFRKVVPDGLENVFTLSLVLALFQASNALLPESGIMTVTAAGFVVGNARTRVRRELMEFKEQLTVMLIGMLFVLLAASVRLEGVFELGYPALLTIACLMFIVRPINIALCTIRTELTVKDRVFLSWIAPRGVVAAAISTLFAQAFDHAGIPGGEPLQALVFAVIAGTVLVQGLTGGVVARLLGLRRAPHRGIAIFGANALGKTIGRLMRDNGQQVIFLERDPIKCKGVEQDGFRVIYGNILDERSMQRAQLEDRTSCLAVTTNEEVNLLVARTVAEDFKIEHCYVALRKDRPHVTETLVRGADAEVVFGEPRDLELWDVRLRRGTVSLEPWSLEVRPGNLDLDVRDERPFAVLEGVLLPMVAQRGQHAAPVNSKTLFRKGDIVHFAIFDEQRQQAYDWLEERGWLRVPDAEAAEEELTEKEPAKAVDEEPERELTPA